MLIKRRSSRHLTEQGCHAGNRLSGSPARIPGLGLSAATPLAFPAPRPACWISSPPGVDPGTCHQTTQYKACTRQDGLT